MTNVKAQMTNKIQSPNDKKFNLGTGEGKPRPYNVEIGKCRGRACPCPIKLRTE